MDSFADALMLAYANAGYTSGSISDRQSAFLADLNTKGPAVKFLDVQTPSLAANTIVNTLVESPIYTFDIPAGAVAAGDLLELNVMFDQVNGTAAPVTHAYKHKLGATTVFAPAAISYSAQGANKTRYSVRTLINVVSLTDQRWDTLQFANTANPNAMSPLNAGGSLIGSGQTTEDMSALKTLAITDTLSVADPAISVRLVSGTLRRIRLSR